MGADLSKVEILDSWGRSGFATNLIEKALTSASGVGQALSPQSLEREMTQTIIRLSPEMSIYMGFGAMLKIASKFHEYNQITALPKSGSNQGESTVTPPTNSTYTRLQVQLQIYRRKGQVTDFLNDVSREYVDTMRVESDNQIQVMIWDMIVSLYFGNNTANTFDINGLESQIGVTAPYSAITNNFIATNRIVYPKGGTALSGLKILDTMIDISNRSGGSHHPRVIFASPEMISALTGYETTIRKVAELGSMGSAGKFGQILIPGGHRLETYRGIALVSTTHLTPQETMTPTITLAGESASATGSLSNGTYYVQIAPVTNQGEQLASTEQSVTLSGGTSTQRIKITLSAAHTNAIYYKIYASATSGSETLNRMVTALFYSDAVGTLDLTQFNGQAGADIYLTSMSPSAEIPAQMKFDPPLVQSNGVNPEYLILQDLDPIQGLGKIVYANIMTGGVFGGLITTEPLAKVDAYRQFLMYSHFTLVPAFERTSFVVRGLRIA